MDNITNAEMVIFSGRGNQALAQEICHYLKIEMGESLNKNFSDGEIRVELKDNVRLRDVFLVQSTNPPAENFLELLLMIDAAKRASAARITAVIPYFGYARQDRKDESRVAISAKLIASLIERAGANRIITMDLHSGQIQGFFGVPVDNLYAKPVLVKHILKEFACMLDDLVLGSPDVGGIRRTRSYAKKINNAPLVIVDKRRDEPNQVDIMNIIGEVRDKTVIVVDDIIDTGRTFVEGAEVMISRGGAKNVYGFCAHPILSGEAVTRIEQSSVVSLTVTDTIPLSDQAKACKKIKVLSVAELFGEAIKRSRSGESVASLFL